MTHVEYLILRLLVNDETAKDEAIRALKDEHARRNAQKDLVTTNMPGRTA